MKRGDRIIVGVSGIDSLGLLWLLRERLAWIPVTYELKAVYIDLGFDEITGRAMEHYLRAESFDYAIIKTDIGVTAHSEENRENPCFYCAWQRRKQLFQLCGDERFNKIALGHHLEDINATFLMNVLYSGSISTMTAYQPFFDGQVTIIRPLAMLYKEQLEQLASFAGIPAIENPCPSCKGRPNEKKWLKCSTTSIKKTEEFGTIFLMPSLTCERNIYQNSYQLLAFSHQQLQKSECRHSS